MVYVPAGNVTQLARAFMTAVLGVVVAAFAVTMLASNALLRSTVISPVGELARVARVVADGSLSPEAFQTAAFAKITNREDELGQLGRVFQQMAEQVYLREQELKARVRQLEIVIDENKLHEQVDAITDTDYFRDLQDRANDLRTRRSEDEEDA
jgi:nitrate/nitrite-specific signal transduction histidine kinase